MVYIADRLFGLHRIQFTAIIPLRSFVVIGLVCVVDARLMAKETILHYSGEKSKPVEAALEKWFH